MLLKKIFLKEVVFQFIEKTVRMVLGIIVIKQLSAFDDVKLVDYNYEIIPITENTDITDFEIVKH